MEIRLSCENLELELEKKKILKDISLEVRSGEILALLGESGCGKSSLLKAMLGLYPLSKGKIFFQGKEIQNLPSHKRGITEGSKDRAKEKSGGASKTCAAGGVFGKAD